MSVRSRWPWALVILLAILHYDFWWWDDRTLLFGFLPIDLGWQALISVGAASAWAWMVRSAWPEEVEAWAAGSDADAEGPGA